MLRSPHFYHRTIRKIVVAFGTVFNDIQLIRFDKNKNPKEKFIVPLSYGSKEKYLTRINSDPNLTKSMAITVPRMSFNMNNISYDSSRKQVSTIKNFAKGATLQTVRSQFVPVPYNFDFSLSIYVRNTEDGTQILEQILPFFTPDFTLTVNFIPEMQQKYDMPIILNSVSSEIDYEGDMSTTRLITWDLDFTVKSYIWPSVSSGSYIRRANTNILLTENTTSLTANSTNVSSIVVEPNPIDADIDDEFGFSYDFSDSNKQKPVIILTEDGFELITEENSNIIAESLFDSIPQGPI